MKNINKIGNKNRVFVDCLSILFSIVFKNCFTINVIFVFYINFECWNNLILIVSRAKICLQQFFAFVHDKTKARRIRRETTHDLSSARTLSRLWLGRNPNQIPSLYPDHLIWFLLLIIRFIIFLLSVD